MRIFKRFTPFLIVLALVLSGCPLSNSNPMGIPGKDPVDGDLKGSWNSYINGYPVVSFTVDKGKKKSLVATITEPGAELEDYPFVYTVYTQEINGKDFAYFRDKSDDEAPYYYVHYRVDGDKLFTRVVREEAFENATLNTMGDIRYEFTARLRSGATDFLDTEVEWRRK